MQTREKTLFPSRILELRGQKGQQEMANLIGEHKNKWSRWELGYNEPDLATLSKISRTFSVSIDWLVGVSDIRSPVLKTETESEVFELHRYKSAFAKLAKSLRNASEVIEELEGGK